ncbi:Major facilitator superfamily MFS_1 [candidate division SR1 bacterium RAAC1_SR1_1]|nr:Major facilitator superfamily MFS_1 [candidate division SR1 bacterium RAAC1_SR1_1]
MFFKKIGGLEGNIWKHFFILFTGRRNFIPILSIYYLSLPNTKAQEIGFYTAVGYAISLIFQIPAGILGDKLGNKTIIILSKIFLVLSSLMFIVGDNFWYFLVGSILMSLGMDAFATGNTSAFLHDTLTDMKKESLFKKISSSMKGRVSFLSIFFIVALPFFTKIDLVLPFKIGLGIDIIGLIIAFSLFPARGKAEHHEPISLGNIKKTLQESKGSGLIPVLTFSAIVGAFLIVDGSFRSPYLESLGYPIIYIGFVMGLSRLVWFVVGKYAHRIENFIPFKKMMLIETFLFSLYYISASFINDPYIVGIIFSLVVGYFRGRADIYTDHIINLIPGQKYKSTILSIRGQIAGIIQIILMTIVGLVMSVSYKLGFFIMGILLFILLMSIYLFFIKENKIKNQF